MCGMARMASLIDTAAVVFAAAAVVDVVDDVVDENARVEWWKSSFSMSQIAEVSWE